MAAPVPPGAPRQPPPPPAGYAPNYQQNPNALSDSFQNMNIHNLPSMPGSVPRPSMPSIGEPPASSPFGQPPPLSQLGQIPSSTPFSHPSNPSSMPSSRPGPPPFGLTSKSSMPLPGSVSPATMPSNVLMSRPSGPPVQASPFVSSRPSAGQLGSSVGSGYGINPVGFGQPPSVAYDQLPGNRPTGFAGPPSSLTAPQTSEAGGVTSNGPSGPPFQIGQRFPPMSTPAQPPMMGRPPPMGAFRTPSQPPNMWPPVGISANSVQQVPSSFATAARGPPVFPPQEFSQPGGPLSTQPIFPSTNQLVPPIPGPALPSRMYGIAPMPNQMTAISPVLSQSGSPMSSQKIDPNQIPRPITNSSVILHETRQGNQANPPPPATIDYIVKDTGNCSPRFLRSTISQIPCTGELLSTSGMQLALLVQPLALPHPAEEPVQVVDFGEIGPVRCSRCKGYINPFMKFIDQGRRFICNLCGYTDETPRDYLCNLGPDGRRRDADDRPELCRGTVEFVATKEYMVRDPMPAVYFFVVDVSMNAVQSGATAAVCSSISKVLADLPEGARTMVGIATFDSTVHFYNLKRALQQPLMLIVPDVQDVYTPLETDVIVPLSECRQHLEFLLDSIPSMFQSSRIAESAFGAAMKAAFLAMKSTGGKLLIFQSVLPSLGIGALSAREAEGRSNISAGDKEAHKMLQPADKTLKEMSIELAEYQVCVDVFITTQSYVDIASVSVVPRTTGGQVYYYFPFSAVSDTGKLYNDLRWNVTRPQGFEAVMRVRCSQGIQVQDYNGNFCKRIPTDVDLPAVDCDKTIMVTLKHDDKLQDGAECSFQCALLYTNLYGQRRIRVATLSLPCTSNLSNLFRMADLDTQYVCFLKQAANQIPSTPPVSIREQAMNFCINILLSYRRFCATVSSSGQLILPEALKLLPLYTLALIKSTGMRVDGRLDDRSFWISYMSSVSAPLAIPLVFPRMISIHDLDVKEEDDMSVPLSLPLSSEHISDSGIYLLENGLDALMYVGSSVDTKILNQLFGVSSVEEIPTQLVLEQHSNPLSKKLNSVLNEIRRQRCSFLRIKVCKKSDQSGMLFLSSLIEDKVPTSGYAYVEFLVHIHRQIQMKMST